MTRLGGHRGTTDACRVSYARHGHTRQYFTARIHMPTRPSPGNRSSGRIAPAIMELVENGTIRVLDLLFVMKDADGVVTTLAAADIGEEGAAFLSIDVAQPGALGPEDAEEVSDDLPSNSSALLIAFENLWAGKLVDALQAADAVVIDSIRIPVDVVEAALTAS